LYLAGGKIFIIKVAGSAEGLRCYGHQFQLKFKVLCGSWYNAFSWMYRPLISSNRYLFHYQATQKH